MVTVSPPEVQNMTLASLDEVMRIEEGSFPDAWEREHFRIRMERPEVICRIIVVDGIVRAFFVVSQQPGCLHVDNVAVDPERRRRGLGVFCLGKIEELARSVQAPRIDLEVREANLPAQLCYQKAGYRAVDILHEHFGSGEDAYLMVKRT